MDRGDQPQHGHSGRHDGKACTAAGDQHLHAADEHDLEIGYREELAHPVYAGADLLVVPSVFEPCGLAPMTAMRYGTVPVVRAVGGMTDTVFDRDYSAGTSAAAFA